MDNKLSESSTLPDSDAPDTPGILDIKKTNGINGTGGAPLYHRNGRVIGEKHCLKSAMKIRRASCPEPVLRPKHRELRKRLSKDWDFEMRRGSVTKEIGGMPCNVILYAGDRRGTIISAKAAATINHHYYPEGDWGWVISGSSALIHAITYGVQFAFVSASLYFYFRSPKERARSPLPDDPVFDYFKGGKNWNETQFHIVFCALNAHNRKKSTWQNFYCRHWHKVPVTNSFMRTSVPCFAFTNFVRRELHMPLWCVTSSMPLNSSFSIVFLMPNAL